ncbi:MAG: EVE domain-containing protein [Ferroplasma sp.]
MNLERVTADKLNINDKIFDTLKEDYKEFGEWFKKIQEEKRKCIISKDENQNLVALMIYKEENEQIELANNRIIDKNPRLKISTFIVTMNHFKFGEALIKIAVDECMKLGITEIYLTHFIKQNDSLVNLISKYGFMQKGKNYRSEAVFLKRLRPETAIKIENYAEFNNEYYPSFYDGKNVNKFIIPIRPDFYRRLFVSEQMALFGNPVASINTIEKIYLSNSKNKIIKGGDLIIFYRSHDKHCILEIGIVESICRTSDKNHIAKFVGDRSVYTKKELASENKEKLIIKFNNVFPLRNSLSIEDLVKYKILKSAPQSITEISEESYKVIKKEGGIDESFTFN